MEWQFVVALLVFMPVILLPAALIWYLNIGGVHAALRKSGREERVQTNGTEKTASPLIAYKQVWVGLIVAAMFAVYGVGLWANWGGGVALAVALAVPVMLVPLSFVVYLNIGGIVAARRRARSSTAASPPAFEDARARAIAARRMRIVLSVVLAFLPPAIIWLLAGGGGWGVTVGLMVAIPVMLLGVAFVWYLNVSGLYQVLRVTRQRRKTRAVVKDAEAIMTGRLTYGDAGAVGGRARRTGGIAPYKIIVPLAGALVPPVLVWTLLAGMGWQIAVAAMVGLPALLTGLAFVWYLNISGLYVVLRETRRRQGARGAVVREAEAIVRGRVSVSEAVQAR